MKNFDEFCKNCAGNGFPLKVASMVKTLTTDQVLDVIQISLETLREYHEWHQQELDD